MVVEMHNYPKAAAADMRGSIRSIGSIGEGVSGVSGVCLLWQIYQASREYDWSSMGVDGGSAPPARAAPRGADRTEPHHYLRNRTTDKQTAHEAAKPGAGYSCTTGNPWQLCAPSCHCTRRSVRSRRTDTPFFHETLSMNIDSRRACPAEAIC
jgi:hypothetical protein